MGWGNHIESFSTLFQPVLNYCGKFEDVKFNIFEDMTLKSRCIVLGHPCCSKTFTFFVCFTMTIGFWSLYLKVNRPIQQPWSIICSSRASSLYLFEISWVAYQEKLSTLFIAMLFLQVITFYCDFIKWEEPGSISY